MKELLKLGLLTVWLRLFEERSLWSDELPEESGWYWWVQSWRGGLMVIQVVGEGHGWPCSDGKRRAAVERSPNLAFYPQLLKGHPLVLWKKASRADLRACQKG